MSPRTGQPIGGCIGFLKTLRNLLDANSPSAVYVAWEGGGSSKRRALFSEYKKNRRPDRPNRFYEDDLPETDDNRVRQVATLTKMLRCLPVCQIYVPDCEGDDVIAYLSRGPLLGVPKIIVTSDKDMYQLIDELTTVYSLHKKSYVTRESMQTEFRISPQNFGLAKALCGDASDNIDGVKGLGFKTLAKRLPILSATDRQVLLTDVFDYCAAHSDVSVIYRRVLEERALVERNWRLVHLGEFSLSAEQAASVNRRLDTFSPVADRMGLIQCMLSEGIGDFDVDNLFYALRCVATRATSTEARA
jgi:5'-3' exonuclease